MAITDKIKSNRLEQRLKEIRERREQEKQISAPITKAIREYNRRFYE